MGSAERGADEGWRDGGVGPCLEDLIPIALVIGAGCEGCATRLVRRALDRGVASSLVERTLRIVAGLASAECLAQAVGPEVVSRMERPLQAARAAQRSHARTTDRVCCVGEPGPSRGSRGHDRSGRDAE